MVPCHQCSKLTQSLLSDDKLLEMSREVPHNKYYDLAVTLGFSYNHAEAVLSTNSKDYKEATTSLLMEWKMKHGTGPSQTAQFIDIFESAGLRGLVSTCPLVQTISEATKGENVYPITD